MSQIIKPVALDETLQITNQKLDTLKSGIDSKASDIKTAIDNQKGSVDNVKSAVDGLKSTLDTDIKDTNTKIDQFKQANTQAIEAMTNALVGAWTSVKSVNGKNGAVVLDGTDLKINKSQQDSKTVTGMMTEMEAAISKTPLTFSASEIEDGDYLLTIALGTPA